MKLTWFCKCSDRLSQWQWIAPLLVRLCVGYIFLRAGWGKLHDLPKVTGFFESIGIPFAHIQAPFVACVEFIGGIALMIGLMGRLFSFLLLCVMTVALITAHLPQVHSLMQFLTLSEFGLWLLLLWLWLSGPKKCSVQAWMEKKGLCPMS